MTRREALRLLDASGSGLVDPALLAALGAAERAARVAIEAGVPGGDGAEPAPADDDPADDEPPQSATFAALAGRRGPS
ncbi:MAG TPA: hypothetical protein VFS00_26495 [Polyangiaceae bacterium]|nr:hypothetical protein [Polyangiaceae bacterium]